MTFKEFTGKNVEEAIRTAMKEFESDLSDLDIEILAQGSRGILGVGGEDAASWPRQVGGRRCRDCACESSRADGTTTCEAPVEPVEALPFAIDEGRRAGRRPGARRGVPRRRRIEPRREAVENVARGGRGRGREPRADRGHRPLSDRPRASRANGRASRRPSSRPAARGADRGRAQRHRRRQGRAEEMLRLMGVQATVEITMGSETVEAQREGRGPGRPDRPSRREAGQPPAPRQPDRRQARGPVAPHRGRRRELPRPSRGAAARRRRARRQAGGPERQDHPAGADACRRAAHRPHGAGGERQVRTQSVGVEPNRRIVVLPAGKVEA